MAVLDFDNNAPFWEKGTWKLYMAKNYDDAVFDEWDGTNEPAIIQQIETDYEWADVWYFTDFSISIWQGDEKVISTDYCSVWEISRKAEKVPWFSATVQEILEMENLALILNAKLNTDATSWVQTIDVKRMAWTNKYQLFKFVTCPKEWKYNVFYFVKAALSSDISIPFSNLAVKDFEWATLEYEVATWWNFLVQKGVAV